MTRTVSVALMCGLVIIAAGLPVWAHHSFAAAYDTRPEKAISVKGTIVNVRLTNPHSFFFLNVKNEKTGKMEEWQFEAGTPSGMIRNGFNKDEIKAGTVVTINGFHAKDPAANAGMLRELITADGKRYGMFGPQEGPNAR
jgi:hypothetical protein